MDKISLVEEDGKLLIRWQMPVDTLIEYRQIISKCASILKCREDQVLNEVKELMDHREEMLKKLSIANYNTNINKIDEQPSREVDI